MTEQSGQQPDGNAHDLGRGAAALGTRHSALGTRVEERIAAEVKKYPSARTALLPALKIAHQELHWLPPEAIARVAELVGTSHASANELATFYSMLHKQPLGHTVVEVCAQLPCALRGADELLDELSSTLGVKPGETTANGAVSLKRTHECFGACHRAPMALVNNEYREHLRGDAREQLIRELRELAHGGAEPRVQGSQA